MTATFCENFKVESAILKDVAGTSHGISGNFTGSSDQEVCLVRGMETIELYQVKNQLIFVNEYKMKCLKIKDVVKVRIPWLQREALCIQLEILQFVVIIYDKEIDDWRTVCLFNFEQMDSLNETGKKSPLTGFLRPFSTLTQSAFIFLCDDTIIGKITFCPIAPSSKTISPIEDQLDENYLHVLAGNAFTCNVQQIVKPFEQYQLRAYGIQAIRDVQVTYEDNDNDYGEGGSMQLVVLHMDHVECMVGTMARYPTCVVSVLEVRGLMLNLIFKADALSQYSKLILPLQDSFLVFTPVSLYLIRQDKNWITEIQTSAVCHALKENFSKDSTKPFVESQTRPERTQLNIMSQNVNFDGSRFQVLGTNKVLVGTQTGNFLIMQLYYDQAHIDLAEVVFKRIEISEKRVSSSLVILEGKFLCTSYFQPTALFALTESDILESDPKRQKISTMHDIGKRKQFNCTQVDSLICLSPITSAIQLQTPTDELFSYDFLISSGNQVESYLTIASRYLPVTVQPSDSKAARLFQIGNLLLISTDQLTRVTSLDQTDIQSLYIKDEQTISVCHTLQLTPTRIANGANVLYLAVRDLCYLEVLFYAIDLNNQLVQISQNLEIKQTGMKAQAICTSEKHLYNYLEDSINVYTWMGRLQLSCKLSGVNKQPAFLKPWYSDESVTELSYSKIFQTTQNDAGQKIGQIQFIEVGKISVMVLKFKSGRFAFYQKLKEGLFKIIVSSFIRTLKTDLLNGSFSLDDKTTVILGTKPFIITEHRNKLSFAYFGYQPISSVISIQDNLTAIVKDTISTISIDPDFLPFKSVTISDGYVLKQIIQEQKGIKLTQIYYPIGRNKTERPVIFVATFRHKQPAPINNVFEMAFASETKATDVIYQLEVFSMPSDISQWKLLAQTNMLALEKFNENQVINEISEVTLQTTPEMVFKNYLAVCTVKVDTSKRFVSGQDDKGFYSSQLNLYQYWQGKVRLCLVENFKRPVTSISSYLGKLVCCQEFQHIPDLTLVFWSFNDLQSKLEKELPIPEGGVKNQATCVSFDQDFIILGDIYKDLSILKKASKTENIHENQDEGKLHIVKFKQSKLSANVIGAYSLSRNLSYDHTDLVNKISQEGYPIGTVVPKTEQQKKMLTVVGVSQNGYVRLYKTKETKQFEVFSQLNLQDKVLSTKPLFAQRNELCERRIMVITQRSGIQFVVACDEKQFTLLELLMKRMSLMLPFRASLTPAHAHAEPKLPQMDPSIFNARLNGGAINKNTIEDFNFLNFNTQKVLLENTGLTQENVQEYLI